MLCTAVIVLSAAVTLGIVLALWHMRATEGRRRLSWPAGILHGGLGIVGLGVLVVLLQGPRRGDAMGVGSFGTTSAVLFAVAAAAGVAVPLLIRRNPKVTTVAIAAHAGLAITGFVLFLAWSSMG